MWMRAACVIYRSDEHTHVGIIIVVVPSWMFSTRPMQQKTTKRWFPTWKPPSWQSRHTEALRGLRSCAVLCPQQNVLLLLCHHVCRMYVMEVTVKMTGPHECTLDLPVGGAILRSTERDSQWSQRYVPLLLVGEWTVPTAPTPRWAATRNNSTKKMVGSAPLTSKCREELDRRKTMLRAASHPSRSDRERLRSSATHTRCKADEICYAHDAECTGSTSIIVNKSVH